MKLKDLSKEELEAMSYDDIALMIITETGKQYKINELFKKVCDLLGLSEAVFMDKLPAFFDVLSTDHRFIMLENGTWDLKTKHSTKVVFESDDEEQMQVAQELISIFENIGYHSFMVSAKSGFQCDDLKEIMKGGCGIMQTTHSPIQRSLN